MHERYVILQPDHEFSNVKCCIICLQFLTKLLCSTFHSANDHSFIGLNRRQLEIESQPDQFYKMVPRKDHRLLIFEPKIHLFFHAGEDFIVQILEIEAYIVQKGFISPQRLVVVALTDHFSFCHCHGG